jgi:hypothetical protein
MHYNGGVRDGTKSRNAHFLKLSPISRARLELLIPLGRDDVSPNARFRQGRDKRPTAADEPHAHFRQSAVNAYFRKIGGRWRAF